jgi:hypothetical protein
LQHHDTSTINVLRAPDPARSMTINPALAAIEELDQHASTARVSRQPETITRQPDGVLAPAAARGALDCYLRMLAGPDPGGRLLEIRFALAGGTMGRVFICARATSKAATLIRRLSPRSDAYVGVALRFRRSGGRDAIDRSHLLFIEIDSVDARQRLQAFASPPTAQIASGSAGHVHAYWQLHTPISVDRLEQANRRLAHHLGGDLASVDGARILRPPSSLNYKHTPPRRVLLLDFDPARRYDAAQLTGRLCDPPGKSPARAASSRSHSRGQRHPLDRMLLAVPAAEYVHKLTGLTANRAGKIRCPFHHDTRPSLQLYEDGSWYRFGGCRQGGSIYDFAALLWLTGTKDREFLELRARLAEHVAHRPS